MRNDQLSRYVDTDAGNGAPPELPSLAPTDEGPMRSELLRQIRRLEIEIGRFTASNCPYDAPPTSVRRGPAVLATAQLEEIRDELLTSRSALHELVVTRATERIAEPATPKRKRRLTRRKPR